MKHNRTIKRTTSFARGTDEEGGSPIISIVLQEKIAHFKEYHPAARFATNLRTMLLEFLMCEGMIEVMYLEDLLYDLLGLFELLDAMEQEKQEKQAA